MKAIGAQILFEKHIDFSTINGRSCLPLWTKSWKGYNQELYCRTSLIQVSIKVKSTIKLVQSDIVKVGDGTKRREAISSHTRVYNYNIPVV